MPVKSFFGFKPPAQFLERGNIVRKPNEGGSVTAVQSHEEDARDEFAKVVEKDPNENTVIRSKKIFD